jgi:hypothetical protein
MLPWQLKQLPSPFMLREGDRSLQTQLLAYKPLDTVYQTVALNKGSRSDGTNELSGTCHSRLGLIAWWVISLNSDGPEAKLGDSNPGGVTSFRSG